MPSASVARWAVIARKGRGYAAVATAMLAVWPACRDVGSPDAPPIASLKIGQVKAYYCGVDVQGPCDVRGAAIGSDSLPPIDKSFQVWAFYQGLRTTHWRLSYGTDSVVADKLADDSAYVYINLHGAPFRTYTLLVGIRTGSGVVGGDSLKWAY